MMNVSTPTHTMWLASECEDMQEWDCKTCGRLLLLSVLDGRSELVVVRAGDAGAVHTGGAGGMEVDGSEITP